MRLGSWDSAPPRTPGKTMRVQFSEPAMSVEQLLAALSKQMSITLACSPEVRDEILLLHVRDLPLQDVIAHTAEVTGAKWRHVGQTWLLERPAGMAKAQQERDINARAAIITQSLRIILAPLKIPWDEATLRTAITLRQRWEKTGQVDPLVAQCDPVYRAFLRCLSDVSPNALARIPVGGRVVFSNHPAPMQQPLGTGTQQALEKLLEEQLLFGTILGKAGKEPGFEDRLMDDMGNVPHSVWERLKPYNATLVRAVLVIEQKWESSYEAQLILLNKENQAVVEFNIPNELLSFRAPWKEKERPKRSPQVPLSTRSRILISIGRGRSRVPRMSPEALRLITDPVKFEPLSMAISDGYRALARAKRRNLIAALSDDLFQECLTEQSYTLDDVLNWPDDQSPMRITDRDGWLIVTPPYPSEARHKRGDRAMLGKIVRRITHQRTCEIKDIAAFAATIGTTPTYHFGNLYLWAVSKGNYAFGMSGNWPLMAVYSALTLDQQKVLLSGNSLTFGSLTDRQRFFVEKVVFGARYNYSGRNNDADKEPRPAPKNYRDLNHEPTECYPHGLPDESRVYASSKNEYVVYFQGPGKTEFEQRYWTMYEEPISMYSGPPPRVPADGIGAFRYSVRFRENITVQVDVTPWFRMGATFTGTDSTPSGPPVPHSELPPHIQKRVNEELLFIRKLRGELPM